MGWREAGRHYTSDPKMGAAQGLRVTQEKWPVTEILKCMEFLHGWFPRGTGNLP